MPSGYEMIDRESQAKGLQEEDEQKSMLVVTSKKLFQPESFGDETGSSESLYR